MSRGGSSPSCRDSIVWIPDFLQFRVGAGVQTSKTHEESTEALQRHGAFAVRIGRVDGE